MTIKEIKEFIRFFDKSTLTELEIEDGDNRLYMSRHIGESSHPTIQTVPQVISAAQTFVSSSGAVKTDKNVEIGKTVQSPMVGTYYSAPAPGAAPFVKIGDIIEKGQTLCIIEAMKIMNTIEADYRCKILKILAENGVSIVYGQDIFVVEPL